jgi:hypothetical protein
MLLQQPNRIASDGFRDGYKLDDIDAPLAAFDFGDERLRFP